MKTRYITPGSAHVVMLAQYLPLHFVTTMQRLAPKVGRLTLLLSEQMDQSRDWAPDFTGLTVQIQRSVKVPIKHKHPLGFDDPSSLIIPYSTIADLRSLRPDVVISVEVGPRTLQAEALRRLGGGFKLIVQVRESENTAQSRGWWRRSVRRTLLPRVDDVFVNGESGRRHVLSCGVRPERITVVPSGTDTRTFGTIVHQPHNDPELRLLYVGQLIPRKGLIRFAQALCDAATATQRPLCWTLAGRGSEEPTLRNIPWPKNARLQFLGSQPYNDLPQLYARADAFVMPSLSDEWGLVVNEAMASGLPILGCTGAQAIEELVEPGYSGWTYTPLNRAELDAGLHALLRADQATLEKMGRHARAKALTISDEFTSAAMAAGVAKVLQS